MSEDSRGRDCYYLDRVFLEVPFQKITLKQTELLKIIGPFRGKAFQESAR